MRTDYMRRDNNMSMKCITIGRSSSFSAFVGIYCFTSIHSVQPSLSAAQPNKILQLQNIVYPVVWRIVAISFCPIIISAQLPIAIICYYCWPVVTVAGSHWHSAAFVRIFDWMHRIVLDNPRIHTELNKWNAESRTPDQSNNNNNNNDSGNGRIEKNMSHSSYYYATCMQCVCARVYFRLPLHCFIQSLSFSHPLFLCSVGVLIS